MNVKSLLSGRRLAQNMLWSVFGSVLPLVVAVMAVPELVTKFGADRFGLLALIWATIGYFSLFDLGLGRALTKLVAERLAAENQRDLPDLVVTALTLMAMLSLFASVVVATITPLLVTEILNIPAHMDAEARTSLWILSAGLPFVIMSAAFVGLLEAHQQFKAIAIVKICLGTATFLGPLVVLQWSSSLQAATGVLAGARVVAALAYWVQCRRFVPSISMRGRISSALFRPLLRFGGWLSASNVVGPLMVYLDRFLIAGMLTLSAVAFYSVPYEVVTRVWVIPVALVGVLFPAFATGLVVDPVRVKELFAQATRIITFIVFPIIAITVLFAPEVLAAWLGSDFSGRSTGVLRWLAVGVFINSLARLPNALLQSAGRPDLITKAYLVELPFYIVSLSLLLSKFGVTGAAIAWTGRVLIDAIIFTLLCMRLLAGVRDTAKRLIQWILGGSVMLGVMAVPLQLSVKIAIASLLFLLSASLLFRDSRNMIVNKRQGLITQSLSYK